MHPDSKKHTLQRLTTLKLDAVKASMVLTFADGEQLFRKLPQSSPQPFPLPAPPAPPIRGLTEKHGSDMAMQDVDIWLGLIHTLAPGKTKWTQSG